MLKHSMWSCALLCLMACGDKSSSSRDEKDAGNRLDGGAVADGGTGPGPGASQMDGGGEAGQSLEGDVALDYCAPLAALLCSRGSECGCGVLVPGESLDTAACTARWTEKCLSAYAPYIQAAAMGKARVLKAEAQACIELIDSLTPACEKPRGVVSLALCAPFVVSDTPVGKACSDLPICAGGLGVCSEGMCKARGEKDAACNSEFDCATGLLCTPTGCQAPKPENEACEEDNACAPPLRCVLGSCKAPLSEGKACDDNSQCQQGLVCEGQKCKVAVSACSADPSCGPRASCGALRTCEARRGVDAACSNDRECASDLYCSNDGKCASLPGIDEPCANGAACAAGLACDPLATEDARCLALPTEGKPCGLTPNGPFACAANLACIDGVCGPVPTNGEPCAQPDLCGPGLACDFTAEGSFCVAPKPAGSACQNEVVCGPAGHCSGDGLCAPDLAAGETCDPNFSECAGACQRDTSFGFSCVAARGLGDTCIFDDECPETATCVPNLAEASCIPEVCELLN